MYTHGSVHRESNLITVQQDATYSVYYISVGSSTCFGCCYIFYILLYIFKNTAFNHQPLFYTSYSSRLVTFNTTNFLLLLKMALQPGVGLGLRYNIPPGLSVPCSISPLVYTRLSQVHGHVIQPSHSWSSSSSCCIQLSVQHIFWN